MPRNDSASVDRDTHVRAARLWPTALVAGLVLIGGCEGENIFVDDVIAPEVEILQPSAGETVPPGDSILVRVAVSDNRGVVRVSMVGVDPATGQPVERLAARDTVFASPATSAELDVYLASSDADGTAPVNLVVTAIDEAGNEGAQSMALSVGGPRVAVHAPEAGQSVRAGMELPIEVRASDVTGINLIIIEYSGVVNDTVQFAFSPVEDTLLETSLVLPGTEGSLDITARASNIAGVVNRSSTSQVIVASASEQDEVAPMVAFEIEAPARMELTDDVRVMVAARDDDGGTGVNRIGFTMLAIRAPADTTVIHQVHQFPSPHVGLAEHEFVVGIEQLYGANDTDPVLPDTLDFEFHALSWDAAGNCGAATGTTLSRVACVERTITGTAVPVAEGATARRAEVVVVEGRTVVLDGGGVIADALIDHGRGQLYLSNFSRNRVEKLDLETLTFRPDGIHVGSQPWGLFMHNNGDTLIVANSGGTNLDFVGLDAQGLPLGSSRLQTPNVALFQVTREEMDGGGFRYTVEMIDFSDRPQFVAQDLYGNLLYSTVPTGSAPDGTVRVAWREAGWDRWEVELLLADARDGDPDGFAIAQVDAVNPCTVLATGEHGIVIKDRVPGSTTTITSGCLPPSQAGAAIADQGSDIALYEAERWDPSRVGLSDTTFVAASGDRRSVVFGEGAAETGRIFMWHAHEQRAFAKISSDISVLDLIHNEPARVTGVDLNQDGTLGIARGEQGTYFFDESLRLQGRVVEGVGGGASAALHPDHTGTGTGSGAAELSFVGTDRNSILILDTYRFLTLGEIPIRDRITGPLEVSAPLPGDPADTVVRVYAITSAGGAALIRIRERDIGR